MFFFFRFSSYTCNASFTRNTSHSIYTGNLVHVIQLFQVMQKIYVKLAHMWADYLFLFVLWGHDFFPQCQSLLNFTIFLVGMTLKEAMEAMEAMEVHAMERASWATNLPQKPGQPVPTKTLPIGTERRDIYACEDSRGNQKSSSLGKIQISY